MSFILDFFKGIAIGTGAILPGISSGVLCVVFGIYEKLLDSVLGFFRDWKKNLYFLFPIVLGIFVGVILFSNVLNFFIEQFPIQTQSIFIGLIIGSVPSLLKEVNQTKKFKLHYIFYLIIALGIGIYTVFLEEQFDFSSVSSLSFSFLMFCGFIMSIGVIVPGVSSTIILMLLGVYSTYLTSISEFYFPVLIPMGIGLFLGCLLCMYLTKFLLNHFYAQTFYTIIGFTLGSIFVLLPHVNSLLEIILSFFCICFGFFISNIGKKEKV